MRAAARYLWSVGPYATALVVVAWVVLLVLVIRPPVADYGIHVSVAERLIAGDRLYLDVWDNKEPLYFLSLALLRWVTPLGGWIFNVIGLVVVAAAAYSLARHLGASARLALVAGWVGAPLVAVSVADVSTVPFGISLTLLSVALYAKGRLLWAGAALGLVPLFSVTAAPVALVALAVLVIVGRNPRAMLPLGLGVVAAMMGVGTLLLLRGELFPYLNSLLLNVTYSQQGGESGLGGILAHLSPLDRADVQVTLVATLLCMALAAVLSSRSGPLMRSTRAMWWASVASAGAVVLVLAVMGKWPGHAKLFAVPAVLALVLVVAALSPQALARLWSPLVVVLTLSLLLAGVPAWRTFVTPIEYARANWILQSAVSAESQAISLSGSPGTYARVGQGLDDAHAIGLSEWTLACPRFHQYWWESPDTLNQSLECLPNVDTILVTDDLYGPVTTPGWADYQAAVEEILNRNFTCDQDATFRLCRRKG